MDYWKKAYIWPPGHYGSQVSNCCSLSYLVFVIPPHTKYEGWVYCFQVVRDDVIPWFQLHFRSISWEQNDGIWPNFAYALILTISRLGFFCVNFHQIVTELWPLMIHDFCQNFVSAQYLENELMKFDQIMHMHWYWQDLGWDCYTSIFIKQSQSYGPWWSMMMIFFRILFPLNILSTKWWNLTKVCICIDIDKIRLGLLHVSFHQIVIELWPLMSHDFCQNFVSA